MNVVKTGLGTETLSGVNTYSGATTAAAGTLVLAQSFTSPSSFTVASGASAKITAGGNKVLTVASLNIAGTGKLDLCAGISNDLVINYTGGTPAATIRSYLASAFSQGAWNGAGIDSSTAGA